MTQTEQSKVRLYDYDKLNTVSLLRRLITDINGQHLHDWSGETEGPEGRWRWIQT